MITEPEMADEPERDPAADVPGADSRTPRSGVSFGSRLGLAERGPWRWAVGGVALASALWATVLQGTGYGRTSAPDLHGYHLGGSLCTRGSLASVVDALPAKDFTADNPAIRRGPSLDQATCTLTGSAPIGGGWTHHYVITVSVALHRKTDPRPEFEDTAGIQAAAPLPKSSDVFISVADDIDATTLYPGLGDRAYLTTGTSRQALSVLDGGAVLSLIVDSSTRWPGASYPPANIDGSFTIPPLPSPTTLRPTLAPAMRHLMTLLSAP